jgi:hypothetical protein
MIPRVSRRRFLSRVSAGTGFLVLARPASVWSAQANERVNLAQIGVGGRGSWFIGAMPAMGTRFAALCDVHEYRLAHAAEKFPDAKRYHDFREMLETIPGEIDAVIVATPDHTHAVASAKALRSGKPVFCEKPLTRTSGEARKLRELAASTGLTTQMGNQGTASDAFRRSLEIIESGALGEIRELLAWNEGGGGGPHPGPIGSEPVPEELHWDLWLGPAAARSYHREWANWHRWRDFSTGQLGNWAVHSTNLAFKAFHLAEFWDAEAPVDRFPQGRHLKVTARVSEVLADTFPKWELITFEAPARAQRAAFRMSWCNGRSAEGRASIEDRLGRKLDWGDYGEKKWADYAGLVVVGARGTLYSTGHNMSFTLLPEGDLDDLLGPPRELPRSPGHEREWLRAMRGGPAPWSNFVEYGSRLTEFLLLGNLATRFDTIIEYDPLDGRVTNHAAADAACHPEYRDGWTI